MESRHRILWRTLVGLALSYSSIAFGVDTTQVRVLDQRYPLIPVPLLTSPTASDQQGSGSQMQSSANSALEAVNENAGTLERADRELGKQEEKTERDIEKLTRESRKPELHPLEAQNLETERNRKFEEREVLKMQRDALKELQSLNAEQRSLAEGLRNQGADLRRAATAQDAFNPADPIGTAAETTQLQNTAGAQASSPSSGSPSANHESGTGPSPSGSQLTNGGESLVVGNTRYDAQQSLPLGNSGETVTYYGPPPNSNGQLQGDYFRVVSDANGNAQSLTLSQQDGRGNGTLGPASGSTVGTFNGNGALQVNPSGLGPTNFTPQGGIALPPKPKPPGRYGDGTFTGYVAQADPPTSGGSLDPLLSELLENLGRGGTSSSGRAAVRRPPTRSEQPSLHQQVIDLRGMQACPSGNIAPPGGC
jgi:hypothetical protein